MANDQSSSISSLSTRATTPEATPSVEDDNIWASDSEHDFAPTSDELQANGRLLSDLPSVKRQHVTDGYREGLAVGKAKVMQKGFDDGYPIGVSIALRAGKIIGCIEGILAAKDVSDASKVSVQKLYEQAKQDLAMSSLLKDMNDEVVMRTDDIPESIEKVLQSWEQITFGEFPSSESGYKVEKAGIL